MEAQRDQNFVTTLLAVSSVDGVTPVTLYADPVTHRLLVNLASGDGTVTDVSVVTANGFAGTVATATTTPAITLSTTVTGIIKGNGTAISTATAGVDYTALAFSTIAVSGQSDVVADSASDTLTLAEGANITITTSGDTITIAATGGAAGADTALSNLVSVAINTSLLPGADNAIALGDVTHNWSDLFLGDGSVINFNNDVTITHSSNLLTIAGGNLAMSANLITGLGDPVSAQDAATKFYVDNAVLGQNFKQAVKYATTAALTATYANGASGVGATLTEIGFGALSIDGNTPSVNDRILVKNQGTTFENGIYIVTVVGDVGTSYVLTRSLDFNQAADIETGDSTFVTSGTALSTTTWAYTGVDNPVIGTNAITWVQVAGQGSFIGGNGITITGTSIAIDTNVTVDKTTVQTLTNKTLTSPTITTGSYSGAQTLQENASIALDPAGSADGKYTGITVTSTAGYTQAFGDLVYLDPTDSRWEAVDANSAAGADGDARGIIGMVVVAGTDGNPCTILLNGVIRADTKFPSFTINNPIYASETAATVTQTQPTTSDVVIRVVGFALTADEMYFNPSPDYITHV